MSSIGLIDRLPEGYGPSTLTQTAVIDAYSQETRAFLAEEARDRFPAVHYLALHIRLPGSARAAQGLQPPNYFAQLKQSPEKAIRFTRMLYEIHLPLAERVADALDMSGVDRLMDLVGL